MAQTVEVKAGAVQPGDTIEYTVYFLNAGGSDAMDVRICDWIQPHQQFVSGMYENNDIALQIGAGGDTTAYTLTAASDAVDRAELATVDNLPPQDQIVICRHKLTALIQFWY